MPPLDSASPGPLVRVALLQPKPLTRVRSGGQIRGVGWLRGATAPVVIDIELGAAGTAACPTTLLPVGKAQCNLSAADISMLTGAAMSDAGSGFVFTVQVPTLPAGPLTLRLLLRTPGATHIHDLALIMLPTPGEAGQPQPLPRPDTDAIRFYIDAPACQDGMAIEPVRGFLSLVGWAIGRDGIDRIEVFVDGISRGNAYHGVRREDLHAAFPNQDTSRAGFAMMLPPAVMRPGTRQLRIDICDKVGRVKEISFSVRAEAPAAGPGPWALRRKIPQAEIDLLRAMGRANGFATTWNFLIVLGHFGPAALAALALTLDSLRWQADENWSLTLLPATAESGARLAAAIEAPYADLRDRIRIVPPARQTSRTRKFANLVDGFLIPLDPGDQLGEDALLELGIGLAQTPACDFVYSDERRIDPADGSEKAFFKPDFSPDLLLGTNYIGRLWAAAPALVARSGLTEADWRAHGEYDAVLRLTECAQQVGHVARVLCARKHAPAEPRKRQQAAIARALLRRGIGGTLRPGPVRGTWHLRRHLVPAATAKACVSIIIPTIAAGGLIRTAIESIRCHTDWPDYEIICIDNIPATAEPELQGWKSWIAGHADQTIDMAEPFNWSRFNNRGAQVARGNYLLFLNDDIEVRNAGWLTALIEQAQRPEIGVVGPQLLYPDGRVQHAGVFLARHAARHAFRFYGGDEPGPFGLARTQREVISVTGAAMMMRREVFDRLGGFDESHAIVNNDLDFNLRVREAGLSVIYTPHVSLLHHEAVSRARLADVFDSKKFAARWGDRFMKGDPFFSRHFSTDSDDYQPDTEPLRRLAAGAPLFAREKIRRIIAVKVDHIGDFVTAFPAFRRIKQHFPQAELTVLAARASLQIAALEPAVDHVVEFNFFHARSEKGRRAGFTADLAALAAELGPQRFDLAIDLRRQADTRPILPATGARWLAGFENGYKHPWLDIAIEFEGDLALCNKHGHISTALVGLVDHIAAHCDTDRAVVRDPLARIAARQVLARLLPASMDAHPIICVHTGAGALNKQWPAAAFAGLIDLLAGEVGAGIVIIGGPDEAGFAKTVIRHVRRRHSVTNLVGRTGLRDLPAVLRAADLYVGNDSGPKHLAAALGVPTIGIHSGSVDAGEWGPVGPHALTIRRDMTCSPCYLARAADCHRALACLDGIRVGDVYDACRQMLQVAAAAPSANGVDLKHAAE